MPLSRPDLEVAQLHVIAAAAFAPSATQRWGLELETFVCRVDEPAARPQIDDLERLINAPLPAGGRLTVEPGGQLEISTAPHGRIDGVLDSLAGDEWAMTWRLAAAGLRGFPGAIDDLRGRQRILDLPRYRAMEAFFDARGPEGRTMMCNTASLQINISHHPTDPARRWRLVNRLAPVLAATFANSPGRDPAGRTWASMRQRAWTRIDPGRTAPPDPTGDPVTAWLRYALGADVMLIRDGAHATPVAPGMSFGHWMRFGHPAGWPSADDFTYHLTTLFPPVRPRGWLELRVLDSLPEPAREVAVLAVAAALCEPAASELERRLPDTATWRTPAARYGLAHPGLAEAATTLFEVIAMTLPMVTDCARRRERLADYRASHVRARRQPSTSSPSFEPAEQPPQQPPELVLLRGGQTIE